MKKSEDIIKEEFERDIELPESLSKNNIVNMLENKSTTQKKTKIKIFPKIISAAAMLAVITVAVFSFGLKSEFSVIEPEPVTTQTSATSTGENSAENDITVQQEEKSPSASALKVAKSEKDLKNHFLKLYAENKIDNYFDNVFNYGSDIFFEYSSADTAVNESIKGDMAPTMAVTAAPSAQSATGTVPRGTTNVQVADVDEGDIIKNDGRYLYIVNHPGKTYSSTNALTIVDTQTMSKIYTGKIELKDSEVLKEIKDDKNIDMFIQDIYLYGNTLTALCTYNNKTYVVLYDITEKHAPKEIRRFDQDGTYTSSRMVDGIIYTVTSYSVGGSSVEEIEENAIPAVDCDCLHYSRCYILDEESTRYIVLSAFDTKDKDSKVNSVSVLGDGFEIYSTSKNLYVYSSEYKNVTGEDDAVVTTNVYSFALNGTEIKQTATGSFKGTCINQYSFDEYGGNLRVAACYYDYRKNLDVSCVYVLDENLNKIGEIADLAHDEQVKAVRFMGETGYVVTFRNTDPLFIIDFSDPTNPKVTGELKIPGFSTYIHPISSNYLVGIGYDGTDENAKFDTVKVSVFDVSDKTNPKETDTFVIKNAYSLVNEDPKAFFFYRERNMIGIPVSFHDSGNTVKSIQTLTIENGKVKDHLGYIHYAGTSNQYYRDYYYSEIFRGTYIGNLLYTISNAEIIEHNLDGGERTRSCVIASTEDKDATVSFDTTSTGSTIVYATTTPPSAPESN